MAKAFNARANKQFALQKTKFGHHPSFGSLQKFSEPRHHRNSRAALQNARAAKLASIALW
jgi:hypothetical protein